MARRLPASLQQLKLIRKNQRFETYRAEFEGQKVFVKRSTRSELQDSIRSEAWGLQSFGQLVKAHTLPFSVPEIIAGGDNYLVTTWAAGRPMKVSSNSPHLADDIGFLASLYASVDSATQLANDVTTNFNLSDKHGINVADRLQRLLATVPYDEYFDPQLIDKALDKIDEGIETLGARLTHADLTPQHILQTPNGTTTVIDFESCSLLWPRFYDIVNYAYNATVYDVDFEPIAHDLIQIFFEELGQSISKHRKALNTIAAVRGLSSIYEHISEPNDLHNTHESLTDERIDFIDQSLRLIVRGRYFLDA